MNKKIVSILIILICIVLILCSHFIGKKNNIDTIRYDGKIYSLLEYKNDNFTYYHNNYNNNYYEVDMIHQIVNDKWDVVFFNEDLYILNKQIKKAKKYYNYDKNYDWYIVFDNEADTIRKSINLSKKEITNLYNLDKEKKNNTIIFDEIDMFADIQKVSKDGLVQGIIVLAKVDDVWYYKTEIMTDDNREYVIKLSDSINKKINNLLKD